VKNYLDHDLLPPLVGLEVFWSVPLFSPKNWIVQSEPTFLSNLRGKISRWSSRLQVYFSFGHLFRVVGWLQYVVAFFFILTIVFFSSLH
jgi:hypothetical protein